MEPLTSCAPPRLEPLSVVPVAPQPPVNHKPADAAKADAPPPVAFPSEPTDRYGFLVTDRRCLGRPEALSPAAAWLENRRTQKWIAMIGKQLDDWEVCKLRRPAVLKRRVRKGVPEALRGRVWAHLAGATTMLQHNPHVYAALVAQDRSLAPCDDAIARDVGRTFPKHLLFRDPSAPGATGQAALFNVLRAYALHDPDVGYCQGMGFLAAVFLSYVPEPDAFWLVVACLNHRRYDLANLYRPGMPKVQEALFVCEQLLKARLPKLAAHLEREGLHPTMYLTQWLLTLFAYSFPFDFVTRVWDAFLHEGWKIVFRVALALLELAQPALLQLKFEAMMDFFRELPAQIDTEQVLAAAFRLPLKRAQLERLREQFHQQRG